LDRDRERAFLRLELWLFLWRSREGERRLLSPRLELSLSFLSRRTLRDRLREERLLRFRSLDRERDDLIFFLIFSDRGSAFFRPPPAAAAAAGSSPVFFLFSSLLGDFFDRSCFAESRGCFFFLFFDFDLVGDLLVLLLLELLLLLLPLL
jgi:hypothetical protein